jgi:hypothetical protein
VAAACSPAARGSQLGAGAAGPRLGVEALEALGGGAQLDAGLGNL